MKVGHALQKAAHGRLRHQTRHLAAQTKMLARAKAQMMGVKQIFIDDLREEFVRDFVFPMFRANALYEGVYLLAALFVLCLLMDWRFARRHALPAWFLRLRVALTTGAVLSLGIAGWVLAGHGAHH